ncbi:MAG: MFS transporter [Caulobacteraceae bacterium]
MPPAHFMGLVIRNWQMVFIAVGLPGLLAAVLMRSVPEPPRRGRMQAGSGHKAAPVGEIVRYLFANWKLYAPMFFGLAFSALETYGVQSWRPTFFIRTYGWTAQQAGMAMGVSSIGAQLLGLVIGTWLTERLARRHDDANMRVVAIMYTISPIFAILGPLMPNPWLAVACAAVTGMCGLAGAVPQNAAMQSVTPNDMRGQITAFYLFVFVVIGNGLGPSFIAAITDLIVRDESLIRYGLAGSAAGDVAAGGHHHLAGRQAVWARDNGAEGAGRLIGAAWPKA